MAKIQGLLLGFIVLFVCAFSGEKCMAEMVKEVAIGVFHAAPNEAEMERYYLRQHGPTIALSSGPWMRRYQLWLPYNPPETAKGRFGALRGRYAELWYPSLEDYLVTHGGGGQDQNEKMPMGIVKVDDGIIKGGGEFQSPLPWERRDPTTPKSNNPVVIVPAIATEKFHSTMGPMELEDTTFIRWVTVIRYPDNVTVEEGEKWFLEVHAKEASKQKGLINFFSHRCLDVKKANSKEKAWVRVNEYWYEDFEAWNEAVIESPPEYTKPSWGGKYPYVEMVSTFIPYMHYVDFLKGDYVLP